MESIVQLRQMMAEQKFFEVQKLVEVQLALQDKSLRHELLIVYFECMESQKKTFPSSLLIELAEFETTEHHHERALSFIEHLPKEVERRFFQKISRLKIFTALDRGQMDELYSLCANHLVFLFENQIPLIPTWLSEIIERYFKHNFGIKLQTLAINLLTGNIQQSEILVKDLILMCVEKSSPKGTQEKLWSIAEILKTSTQKGQLEIYQNFCLISAEGLKEKSEFKKLVEMVIYFDDFKFQTLILNLLHQQEMDSVAQDYAETVKSNPDYDFVYFDKYFSHLKSYFIQKESKKVEVAKERVTPDLALESDYTSEIMSSPFESEISEEEERLSHLVKYQTFTVDQLCDLAVSFLQTEFPRVALAAAVRAEKQSSNDVEFLKSAYLKLTSLMQLKDYRAAMDVCLIALSKAVQRDDILSFMYGQAEIHIRLKENKQAKIILSKLMGIDSNYRLAKERLEKLNEI